MWTDGGISIVNLLDQSWHRDSSEGNVPNTHIIAFRVGATSLFVKAQDRVFTRHHSRDRADFNILAWEWYSSVRSPASQRKRLRDVVIVELCAQQFV
jgi:hypothetical protein